MLANDFAGQAPRPAANVLDYAEYDEAYFYGRAYRDYDRENPPYKLDGYSRTIEMAVRTIDRPRVLDVGCAFGRLLAGLPEHFERIGIDVSSYALEQARRHVPNVTFLQSDLPPHDLGRFDAISACDVLDEVADLPQMLHRLAALLTPGGELLAVIPVCDGPLARIGRFSNAGAPYRNRLTRTGWLALIGESFDIVEWRGVFRFLAPVVPYVHATSTALRRTAPAIVLRARAVQSRPTSVRHHKPLG